VLAIGQSEEVVVTGDPSTKKGTRPGVAVQNYIRFNDLLSDCAKPTLVNVSVQENDLYAHDTDYIPYLAVSILVIALMMGGLLQSGTAAAKEWENQTIKELLLSPASRWAIMVGKMLGSFLMGLGSTVIVLVVLILIVGVRPENWGEVLGFALLSCSAWSFSTPWGHCWER
jgi:ABC-type transport system involved in multi-copper enzyme maturation permease subunit